jgi:peptidoglycan hydrolase-like protein with peptidoglycan-binding domain
MGPNTRRCIRAFQRANGLQASGGMNPATRKMLRQVEDESDDG